MNTKLPQLLISAILLELFIGGSGQLFKVFGVPLRQVFFLFLFVLYSYDLALKKIRIVNSAGSLIMLAMIVWVFVSAGIGLINGHNKSIIVNDVSPMLYFLMYFPLSSYFKKFDIGYEYLLKILLFSSLLVSIFLISTYLVLKLVYSGDVFLVKGILDRFLGEDIIWFRRGGFVFYPGLIYVVFSSVILFGEIINSNINRKYYLLIYALGVISILLSMTKGLILSLIIGHIILFFGIKKTSMKNGMLMMTVLLVTLVSSSLLIDFSRFSNLSSDTGVNIRLQVIEESVTAINEAVVFGNGFGFELSTKKHHQENSYLDVFVEQGFIGLLIYGVLILHIIMGYQINKNLVAAAISIILMSITNPVVNNPLGIGILILSVIILEKRKKWTVGVLNV